MVIRVHSGGIYLEVRYSAEEPGAPPDNSDCNLSCRPSSRLLFLKIFLQLHGRTGVSRVSKITEYT